MILSSPMTRLCWSLCAWMAWSSSALAQTAPTFTDIGAAAGITSEGQHHAVAIGDYNNDGFEDIYVGSKFAPNALYRNNGDMTFTEVGAEAGVADEGFTNAAIWFDVDNDGDLDLAVGNGYEGGKVLYFKNVGNATSPSFEQKTGAENPWDGIDVGDWSNPSLADLDGAVPRGMHVKCRLLI